MQSSVCSRISFCGPALQVSVPRTRKGRSIVTRAQSYFNVRPYTIRKGDTANSIATKRTFKLEDLKHLNNDVNLDSLAEGQTILIPAGKLSARDREILSGIGPSSYRLYPVRAGETVEDIMSKRGILRSEMEALNPSVNLDKLKELQVLKLPAFKFTVREKEMLTGTGLVPLEFFSTGKTYGFGVIAAVVVAGWVAFWTRKAMTEDDDYEECEE